MVQLIETDRLILRPYTTGDAAFFFRLANDPSWLEYIGDRKIYSVEDAEKYLLEGPIAHYKSHGYGFGLVVLKSAGIPIGSCGITKRPLLDYPDIGFAFLPEYTGNGYAYEIASATMAFAREVLNLDTICAITTPNNERSIKLLGKIGLHFQKRISLDEEELCLFITEDLA